MIALATRNDQNAEKCDWARRRSPRERSPPIGLSLPGSLAHATARDGPKAIELAHVRTGSSRKGQRPHLQKGCAGDATDRYRTARTPTELPQAALGSLSHLPGGLHRGHQPQGDSQPPQGDRTLHERHPRRVRGLRAHPQQLLRGRARACGQDLCRRAQRHGARRPLHAHLLPPRKARPHPQGGSRERRVVLRKPVPHRPRGQVAVRPLHAFQGAKGHARGICLHHRRVASRVRRWREEPSRLPRAHHRLDHRDRLGR